MEDRDRYEQEAIEASMALAASYAEEELTTTIIETQKTLATITASLENKILEAQHLADMVKEFKEN